MIAGFTHEELLHELLVAPRGARGDYPGSEIIDRPDWFQIITPSFRQGGLNEVSFAQIDGDVDAVIDATLARYDSLGIRFRWAVPADSRPADLGERLRKRGMTEETSILMAAAIADLKKITPPPDITVVPVDLGNVETFAETNAAGWGVDPAPMIAFNRYLLANPANINHGFLAFIDGRPVAAANYAALARSAYFMGGVVLPEFRGRGAYRALLAARLDHAAARGIPLATTQARPTTSAPILAALGFHKIGELPMFFNR
jgi:GNAT superfamily N-acetyltransferase